MYRRYGFVPYEHQWPSIEPNFINSRLNKFPKSCVLHNLDNKYRIFDFWSCCEHYFLWTSTRRRRIMEVYINQKMSILNRVDDFFETSAPWGCHFCNRSATTSAAFNVAMMMLDKIAKAAFASIIFEGSVLLSIQQPTAVEENKSLRVGGEKWLGNRKDTDGTWLRLFYVFVTILVWRHLIPTKPAPSGPAQQATDSNLSCLTIQNGWVQSCNSIY